MASAPRVARAQEAPTPEQVAEGRQHFELAVRLFDRDDLEPAAAEFQRAWELARRPGTLFNLAVTLQRLRRYPEAVAAFERFLAESPRPSRRQRRAARRALDELRPMLVTLRVRVEPSDASVSVGDRAVAVDAPLTLTAGRVLVRVSREGYLTQQREVALAAGDARVESFSLQRPPEHPELATPPALTLRGAPEGAALRVDGELRDAASPPLAAGSHRIEIEAAGYLPWRGEAVLSRGERYVLEVQLARRRDARSSLPRWIFTGVAGVAGVTAIGTGVGALTTYSDFRERTQASPDAQSLSSRGQALAVTADIMTGVAVTAGAVALWLWLRPEPAQEVSRGGVVLDRGP